MTEVEIYRLVLETLGAIGAIGGVGIGLWAMLRKKPPFAIRAIEVNSLTTTRTGAMRAAGPAHEVSHSLILKIENLRDTKMQVFGVDIDADHSKSKKDVHMMGTGLAKADVFIPENSIYEVEYKLDSKSVAGTYSKAILWRLCGADHILTLSEDGRRALGASGRTLDHTQKISMGRTVQQGWGCTGIAVPAYPRRARQGAWLTA